METLIVTSRDGQERALEGKSDRSVMENLRDNGYDEVLVMCGGVCSCATCHVFIEPSFLSKLPTMSDDEDDLLDGAEHRRADSRLSCQVMFTSDLDGLRVTIAPEE